MDKYKDLKSFFDEELKDINFNTHFLSKLHKFRIEWSTKSDEYIDFLGSNLLGVHQIRFSIIDESRLAENVFGITNVPKMQKELYEVKGIVKSHKVSSNLLYNLLVYAMYRIQHSSESDTVKNRVKTEAGLVMSYMMITSLYVRRFNFLVKDNIATTVYERMSQKFLIKQLGSWQAVFINMIETIINKKGVNYRKLQAYTTDDGLKVITDIQTKIRSHINHAFNLLMIVLEEDLIIKQLSTTSSNVDGDKVVGDIDSYASNIKHTIKSVANKDYEFIDPTITKVVLSLYPSIKEKELEGFISYMTNADNLDVKDLKKLGLPKSNNVHQEVLEAIISISILYLQRYGVNITDRNNIPLILTLLKNYWNSGRSTDPRVEKIKKYIAKQITISSKRKTKWLITGLTTAYIVYIYMRSIKSNVV